MHSLIYTQMSDKSWSAVSHAGAHIVQNKDTPGQGPNWMNNLVLELAREALPSTSSPWCFFPASVLYEQSPLPLILS